MSKINLSMDEMQEMFNFVVVKGYTSEVLIEKQVDDLEVLEIFIQTQLKEEKDARVKYILKMLSKALRKSKNELSVACQMVHNLSTEVLDNCISQEFLLEKGKTQ